MLAIVLVSDTAVDSLKIGFIKTYIVRFEEISEPLACNIDFEMKVAA